MTSADQVQQISSAQSVSLEVDVQNAISSKGIESVMTESDLALWANRAYSKVAELSARVDSQVTIRLVEKAEITELNRDYRGKDKATNVLSFPVDNDFPDIEQLHLEGDLDFPMTEFADFNLLGDVIICHEVIEEEALAQSKQIQHHYAHMVVHGILHLCGYDHQDDPTAEEMEALEVDVLAQYEITNPYL